MIIQTSNVHMSSEHQKTESISQTRSFDYGTEGKGFLSQLEDAKSMFASNSSSFFASMEDWIQSSSAQEKPVNNSILVMTDEGVQFRTSDDKSDAIQQREVTKAKLLESLLDAINPKRRSVGSAEKIELPEAKPVSHEGETSMPLQLKPITMEVSFRVSETIEEYECSKYSSCGKVTTADGREIEFDLNLEMERSYSATREFEMTQTVEFTDPLILNFEGNHADLSDEKFEFDLDADGDKELISYLSGNGGMLAIDKNKDGKISDGSELFGALTGNGFADLAQYDEDGNNYIDEGDSIFDDLLIWSKTEDVDQLNTLADKGVGAIYLGASDTPFDLKGEDNQQNGRVRSSGFYLTEAGNVGTVQQVDMVV